MKRGNIYIRDYRTEDYDSLIRLWEQTDLTHPERGDDAQTIAETLRMGGKLLLMVERGSEEIIGSSWMTCDGRRVFLHHFGVRSDQRRRGLGNRLLRESMKFVKAMNKQVKLEVHKDNLPAIRLYERHGFSAYKDFVIFMLRSLSVLACLIALDAGMPARGQSDLFADWDTATVNLANTGAGIDYLSNEERAVILLTNMARLDGPLFARTFLENYLKLAGIHPNEYVRSLQRDLQQVWDLPVLVPEKDLARIARDHAAKSGKSGHAGHRGFKNRYKEALNKYMAVGENCNYGNHSPIEIVMRLLIDEDVPDLGHRYNMIDKKFNAVGVSIKPHKVYDYNCVMSFGSLGRSYLDYVK